MATADLRWKVCAFGIHWWAPKEPIPVTRMYILAPQPQQPWPWLWSLDFRQLVGLKLLVECWFPTKLKNSRSGFIAVGKSRFGSSSTQGIIFESLDLPKEHVCHKKSGLLATSWSCCCFLSRVVFPCLMGRLGSLPLVFPGRFFFHQKRRFSSKGLLQRKGRKSRLDVPVDDSIESGRIDPVGRLVCVTNSQRWGWNQSVKSCSMNQE